MKYFQIGIVGVAVLLIPLISNQHDTSRDWRSLRATMIATICDLLTEMMCWVMDGQTYQGAMAINTFFAYWTIVFQSLVALLWFNYVLQLLDWEVPHRYKRLIYLPFIFNMVDLALNPFTNGRFIITAANRYTLGPYAPLDIAVTSIYVLAATIMAIVKLRHAVNAYEKHSCYVIIASIILLIIGMTLQWVFDGSYLLLIFFAIGLLCIFINIQNNHITMDSLTGIYNRAYLLVHYDRMIKRVRPESAMFMLVIDVDEFKKVNDTLGHLAGDHALIEIADVLKETCTDGNGLPARIGGDEFCVIYQNIDREQLEAHIDEINGSLAAYNEREAFPMPLSVSIGYAECRNGDASFDIYMREADRMMYANKDEKKRKNRK